MKNNLQQLRWEKNWSQQQLSLYSGVRKNLIGKIENGNVETSTVRTALLLAQALKVSVEDIFSL